MPPKRQRAVTPPSVNKRKVKKAQNAQPSIDSFFASPFRPSRAAPRKDEGVISISDSEDDLPIVASPIKARANPEPSDIGSSDEALARKLAEDWAKEDQMESTVGKGKAKDLSPVKYQKSDRSRRDTIESDDDDGIVALDPPYSSPPGINGSSSSSHKLPPPRQPKDGIITSPASKQTKGVETEKREMKPLASIFSKPAKPKAITPPDPNGDRATPIRDIKEDKKPDIFGTPRKGNGSITSTSADSVEAIDFDTDAFLFRPEDVDTSKWPKGRLPYSILVGCYVQVSSTKSRLLIVRVLTK